MAAAQHTYEILPILTSAMVATTVAFLVSTLLVATRRWHIRMTGDSHLHLPQKIHRDEVPRVGGMAIVAGFLAGLVHLVWFGAIPPAITDSTAVILMVGLAPIALVGFGEDLTKRVGPRLRLFWIAVGSVILIQSSKLALTGVDVPLFDPLFSNWGFALAFSVFACVGAANAYNIVDGLNGLLAGVSLITLAAIAWVAATVGDQKVFALAVLLGVATVGWLPFNWPKARLFAGDGGAYSLGFLTAALLLMLIHRNHAVSPWFGLTAAALPVWETLYSIWRRSRTGLSTMEPDQSHLHQLVRTRMHRSMQAIAQRRDGSRVVAPNGAVSPILWSLHAAAVTAGAAWFETTFAQAAVFTAFAATYVVLHRWLLRSRAKHAVALAA